MSKTYITRIIYLLIIIILTDVFLGRLLNHLYFKQQSGFQQRITYSMNQCTDQLVFLGTSTTTHHYIPSLFQDSLKITAHNAGIDGSGIFHTQAVLRSMLLRYKPELVIVDIHPEALIEDIQDYDRLTYMLPYYKTHPEIRDIVQLRSKAEKLKHLSSIYPFNSKVLSILKGNAAKADASNIDKGYVPIHKTLKQAIPDTLEYTIHKGVDGRKVEALVDIIAMLNDNDIPFYIIRSPRFEYIDNLSTQKIEQIAAKYQARYIDFSTDEELTLNSQYYSDVSHLNHTGAEVLSNKLIQFLSENE